MNNVAPSPAVEHIPTVFRKIRTGEYRIPAFQRDFVWEERQVLDLMESIYKGYPIGSILLWRVDKQVFQSLREKTVGFPTTEERFPSSFILDGAQRLSALNGTFAGDEVLSDKRLQINFDLELEVFFHIRDAAKFGQAIPLKSVFHPRAFLSEQQRLAALPQGDHYLDRAVRLLSTFQEYMIPVVTIEGKSSEEVVDIFQRINSTGTRLGVVDFIRALTWSDKFDLSIELSKIQNEFELIGFSFEEELLLKGLGIVLGLKPLPDVLLSLREKSAVELHGGIRVLSQALQTTTAFVAEHLAVSTADALPYEAQWLFMVAAVHAGLDIALFGTSIERWIKITSLLETLQGRPDHALARMIEEMVASLKDSRGLEVHQLDLSPQALLDKRFTRGKATTVAFIEMLAERGLFEHAGIEGPLKTVPYDLFVPILSREDANSVSSRKLTSARTIPNVAFLGENLFNSRGDTISRISKMVEENSPTAMALLKAQFIDGQFVDLIRSGDVEGALKKRAQEIIDYAKSEWNSSLDRPRRSATSTNRQN